MLFCFDCNTSMNHETAAEMRQHYMEFHRHAVPAEWLSPEMRKGHYVDVIEGRLHQFIMVP